MKRNQLGLRPNNPCAVEAPIQDLCHQPPPLPDVRRAATLPAGRQAPSTSLLAKDSSLGLRGFCQNLPAGRQADGTL